MPWDGDQPEARVSLEDTLAGNKSVALPQGVLVGLCSGAACAVSLCVWLALGSAPEHLPKILLPLCYPLGTLGAMAVDARGARKAGRGSQGGALEGGAGRARAVLPVHVFLVTVLPAAVQAAFGTFEDAGAVVLWSFVGPVTTMAATSNVKRILLSYGGFAAVLAGVGVVDFLHLDERIFPCEGGACGRRPREDRVLAKVLFYITAIGVCSLCLYVILARISFMAEIGKVTSELVESIIPKGIAEEILAKKLREKRRKAQKPRLEAQAKRRQSFRQSVFGRNLPFLQSAMKHLDAVGPKPRTERRPSVDSASAMRKKVLSSQHKSVSVRSRIGSIARRHRESTIIFIDVVGFTEMSQTASPQVVMQFLDNVFYVFDKACTEYNVLKLRTIGDGYLAATGLMGAFGDELDELDHAERAILYCTKIYARTKKVQTPNRTPLGLRFGIHSGKCYSGIVGITRPQYDVFGTVPNIAARLEQSAKPGSIHLSQATRDKVGTSVAKSFDFQPQPATDMKGVGKMTTYFLDLEVSASGRAGRGGGRGLTAKKRSTAVRTPPWCSPRGARRRPRRATRARRSRTSPRPGAAPRGTRTGGCGGQAWGRRAAWSRTSWTWSCGRTARRAPGAAARRARGRPTTARAPSSERGSQTDLPPSTGEGAARGSSSFCAGKTPRCMFTPTTLFFSEMPPPACRGRSPRLASGERRRRNLA